MIRVLWAIGGWTSLALGVIGVFLPIMPTVPFLLLASICFARVSPRLHRWLRQHPEFGQPIRDWEEHGAIPRRAKVIAITFMTGSFGLGIWLLPRAALIGQGVVLLLVAIFIATRPAPPRHDDTAQGHENP